MADKVKPSQKSAIVAVRNRIVSVKDAHPYAKVMLYGRNGSEKTRTAATAPKCFLIDIEEEGTKSIRGYDNVDVFPAKSWKDIVHAYWFLRAGGHGYESVVLDTLTMMEKLCMKRVLRESSDRDPGRDPRLAQFKEWNKLATMMGEQLLWYRNLPMHVVFVVQERTIELESGDETISYTVPDLSKSARGTATSCVDFIGRMYKKEVTNKKTKKKVWRPLMLIGDHELYLTKDQSGVLPRIVVNPTIPQIIEAAKSIPEE